MKIPPTTEIDNIDSDLLEDQGSEAFPDNLNLFDSLSTQVCVTSSREEELSPITAIDRSGNIHFKIISREFELIDPNETYVYCEFRIVDENGNPINELAPGDILNPRNHCLPVNSLGTAIFKDCQVKINNTIVSESDGLYAYRADFENRLCNSESYKKGNLSMAGFFEEKTAFDDIAEGDFGWNDDEEKADSELYKRYALSRGSHPYWTFARIHSEIFDQQKYLPPWTTVDVIFDKSDQEFLLLQKGDNLTHRVELVTCKLICRFVTVDPIVLKEITDKMEMGFPAVYPIRRVYMTYYTKAGGGVDFSESNLLQEQTILPRRIFFAMVKQAAFHGNHRYDPFNYQMYDVRTIALRQGGQVRPYPELEVNRARRQVIMPMYALLRSVGGFHSPHDLGITTYNHAKRNFFIGYDLTPTNLNPGTGFELPATQTLDIQIKLGAPPPGAEPVTLLVYAEYDAEIIIDKDRKVTKRNFGIPN